MSQSRTSAAGTGNRTHANHKERHRSDIGDCPNRPGRHVSFHTIGGGRRGPGKFGANHQPLGANLRSEKNRSALLSFYSTSS